MANKKKPDIMTPPTPVIVEEPKTGLMDRMGLIIYQGVIILVVLVFMLLGIQKVQSSVDKANETLICVLSIPPDQRNQDNLEKCK